MSNEGPEKELEVKLTLSAGVANSFNSLCWYEGTSMEEELKKFIRYRVGYDMGERLNKIRRLNDDFRYSATANSGPWSVRFLGDVEKLVENDQREGTYHRKHILDEIQDCVDYTNHEHSFGIFEYLGTKMCFKITYSDREDPDKEDPDPSNAAETERTLIIKPLDRYIKDNLDSYYDFLASSNESDFRQEHS